MALHLSRLLTSSPSLSLPSNAIATCSTLRLRTFPVAFTLNASFSSANSAFFSQNCAVLQSWKWEMMVRIQRKQQRQLVVKAARVEAQTVPLGTRAPNFELPEPLTGKRWSLEDFEGNPALLVMFICNHCPFVIHLKQDIVRLSKAYIEKGLAVVAISSNSIKTHPQDGPDKMAQEAKMYDYPFPYLYDETQDVARAYGAKCTPDFFVFQKAGRRPFELVYHGQYDDSRPGNNRPITGSDLRQALDCALSGRLVSNVQRSRFFLK